MCFGLPILLLLGENIDLVKGKFICSKIQHIFPLTLESLEKGLPNGISLNRIVPIVSDRISSNIKISTSSMHYISTDDFASSLRQPCHSDKIIAIDKFRSNFLRELEYVSISTDVSHQSVPSLQFWNVNQYFSNHLICT